MMRDPSFFFSPHGTETATQHVSIYLDNSIFGYFKELIKQHGDFELKGTQDGFSLHIGDYEFTISEHTDSFCISLTNISSLSKNAGELMAKLTFLLFWDKYAGKAKLKASSRGAEQVIWVAGTEQGLHFQPENPEQAKHFQEYAKERNQELQKEGKASFQFDPSTRTFTFSNDKTPKPGS